MTTTKPQSSTEPPEPRLLPCPLFGHLPDKGEFTSGPYIAVSGAPNMPKFYAVVCPGCCSTAYDEDKERVIKKWNTRISPASTAPVVDDNIGLSDETRCAYCGSTDVADISGEYETGVVADGYRERLYEEGFRCQKCGRDQEYEPDSATASPVQASVPAEGEELVSEVDRWKRDLLAAGWRAEFATSWRAPDGGLWRGPFGAWKELQRRIKALGLDTNWPLQDVLTQSADWLKHLGDTHNCDCHGWEAQSFLIEAATNYATASTVAPLDTAAIPLLGYERVITIEWDKHNARRHELTEAKRSRLLSEAEISELRELQWLAGIKRELQTGPNVVAPVEQSDELGDEVQHRMDQVVEAAVEWHQAGREGAEWFEAAERLGAAIDSLLELRGEPSQMPRRWCSVHNREEFKYESLEHELRAAAAPAAPTEQSDTESPREIWMHVYADADCWCSYHFTKDDDPRGLTKYVREGAR